MQRRELCVLVATSSMGSPREKADAGYFCLNLGYPLGRSAYLGYLTEYHRLDGINNKLIFLMIIKVGK